MLCGADDRREADVGALRLQVSGASPFWCAKATRDAKLRQSAKYHQEHKQVLAQLKKIS